MLWTPKPYQLDAARFLLSSRYKGLILDMGLGKTSISLYSIMQLIKGGMIRRVLLVAPIRTLYTVWPTEIQKWDNFRSLKYHNWHESKLNPSVLPSAHIYGINPESLAAKLYHKYFEPEMFDLIIIDESHMFKNPASQRFKALKKFLHKFKYRWILTGTPAPNGLQDLWSQAYILDRGAALGEYITHFRNRFCVPDRSGYGYEVMEAYKPAIYEALAPLLFRLPAQGYVDMPEVIYNEIQVELPAEARRSYKEMEKTFITYLKNGESVTSANAAVAGMKCRQIANGGIYLADGETSHIHDAKAEALKEVVEELQGNPLLIFYEFIHDVERIQKVLGNVPNLTQSKNVTKLVEEFNAGKHPVVIGHPATVGVGLNLQASCHNVLWMGPPWDLAAHDQANARVARQGQPSDRVIIHYLIASGTLDARVIKVLAQKSRVQQDLLTSIQEIASKKASAV